jgi:aurora kinase, other
MHPPTLPLAICMVLQEADAAVLVQEYAAGGDLSSLLRKSGGAMSEADAVHLVLRPLLQALVHLHSMGVVHR